MVSKWATKLNHSRMSRRRQTRHIRRNKLKSFSSVQICEPWPRRQSSRCQDYDQVASHEEVSNQSKPRGATPLASRALSGVHWQCQIGPQGVRPCFVRQVSRRKLWRQEDDVLKQCERLKKSRGIETELDGSQKRCASLAWDSLIRMRLDGQPPCQSTVMQWFSRVNLSAEDVTQLAASLAHGRLRCAGWLGSVALARSSLLCGEGLVP